MGYKPANTIIPLTESTKNTIIIHWELPLSMGVFSIADFEISVEILGKHILLDCLL